MLKNAKKIIDNMSTFAQFETYITDYDQYIMTTYEKLIKKLSDLENHGVKFEYFPRVFTFMMIKYDMNEVIYDILQAYYNMINIDDILLTKYKTKISLLFLFERLKNDNTRDISKLERSLLQYILDVYIKTDKPNELIATILHDDTSIFERIENAYKDKQLLDEFISVGDFDHEDLANLLLICKILHDLFLYKESRIEFVTRVQSLEKYHYKVLRSIDDIEQEYSKHYSNKYQRSMIYDILYNFVYIKDKDRKISNISKIIQLLVDINKLSDNDLSRINSLLSDILSISQLMLSDEINEENKIILRDLKQAKYSVTILPEEEISEESFLDIAIEKVTDPKRAGKEAMRSARIHRLYRNYKDKEDEVDSKITNFVKSAGKFLTLQKSKNDLRNEIVEGKKFSVVSILKKGLSGYALFNVNGPLAIIAMVTGYAVNKKRSVTERKKILSEIEHELEILEEKIQDARGDENREAKYKMMRIRAELKSAYDKIRLGLVTDEKTINTAKNTISSLSPIKKGG